MWPTRDTRALLLAAVWSGTFMAVLVLGPAQAEPILDALFIYYQPIASFLLMLWLWAALVSFFEESQIRYEACFASEHLRFLLSGSALFGIASVLTTVTAASLSLFLLSAANGYLLLASYQPALLYLATWTLLMNPLDFVYDYFYSRQRWFFLDTLRRVVLPLQMVAFTDFLLADILTSLAKPLSDLGLALCHLGSQRALVTSLAEGFDPDVCSNRSWQIPLVLALPYVWRFIQCLIIFVATGDTGQFFNAVKYSTAWPVVYLSFVKYSVPLTDWRGFWKPLWVASAVINTSYSFYWDVERDWDIRFFSNGTRFVLRQDVRMFHDEAVYHGLIGLNFVLRIAWTYKLSSHLRHRRWFVLTMAMLEILRRFLWAFVRVENELRKVQGKQPALGHLIPSAVSLAGYVKRKNSQWALTQLGEAEGNELARRAEKQDML